jgi:hypothetical protein
VNTRYVVPGVIAVAVVAIGIGAILLGTSKNRLALQGDVLKIRTRQADPERTIALLDVRLSNPSTQLFMVKEVHVFVEEEGGKSTEADVFSDVDAKRTVEYYATLGKMYNPSLVIRDKIASGQTVDRTLTLNVPMGEDRLAARTRLILKITDADGGVVEVAEQRKP